ncbi:MAG TPA: metallophosphoesterase [Rhizomicrobium sp.]
MKTPTIRILAAAFALGAAFAAPCSGASPTVNPRLLARWVQMAPGGAAEARAVVSGAVCPALEIDGVPAPMRERAAPDSKFPVRICALTLPKAARRATLLGEALPLPRPAPAHIVVLGDTGCRIKNLTVQACDDPAQWPFHQVATSAAREKPDLVIHVGDYLYREGPCPPAQAQACGGTPWGDNWATWDADFFAPAAPLLAAAPIVVVRGNHEECARSGAGWLRLLGPLPFSPHVPCTDHVAPYAVPLGTVTLAVMDDAHASDLDAPGDLVALYRADFASIAKLAPAPVFLVMHRPVWGVVKFAFGMVLGGNRTLMAAQDQGGIPPNVTLMLAGHIHTFEAINYEKGAPPQILAGEGGDLLDSAPSNLAGQSVGTLKIASGLSLPGYGFLSFRRAANDAWSIDVLSAAGAPERTCAFARRHLDCGK